MTTNQIASRLVELCRQGQFETAQKELFAKDAMSIEPNASPAFDKETKGLNAIMEKGKKWENMVESMNKLEVSEPMVASNSFACTMHMDVTMKNKEHWDMTELCTYTIKDGKIVTEQFFA
jgi:hypothetical protein